MIHTSQAYKDAIKTSKPQRVLVDMGDVILNNDDISVSSGGVKFEDRFNEESEIKFGVTPSNSITLSLINRDGFFNRYNFGTIKASIGVQVQSGSYYRAENVTIETEDGKRFVGRSSEPYLLENDKPCTAQPTFPVYSIVLNEDTLYCFGIRDGEIEAFKTNNYDGVPVRQFNRHVLGKIRGLTSERRGIAIKGNVITDYLYEGVFSRYEYVKLGTFLVDSPSIVRKSVISVEANDQMQLFEDDLIDEVGLVFPITLKDMLHQICAYKGVDASDEDFLNSDLVVRERPEDFDQSTIREVVAWIAEAACSYAKFDRDGVLRMRWFDRIDSSMMAEKDYKDFTPMAYQVNRVDALTIRNSNSYTEGTYGSGRNTYLIQNNPFLRQDDGSSSAYSLRRAPASHPILDRVSSIEEYYPSSATVFGDPSIEAGDVISVKSGDDTYSVPIFSMNTSWSGSSVCSIENSGNERRTIPPLEKRNEYKNGRDSYNQGNAISGLGRRATELEEAARYARIDIDDANARIGLNAGEIDRTKKYLSAAGINIDGVLAEVKILATKEMTDDLTGRVEKAESSIKVNADNIELKVSKNGVISSINQSAESVVIKASKINLDGYVTASQLSTEIAALENGIAKELYVGDLSCGSFNFKGTGISFGSKTFVTSVSLKKEGDTILDGNGVYKYAIVSASVSYNTDKIYYLDWE